MKEFQLLNKNFVSLFISQLCTHLGDSIIQVILIAAFLSNMEKPGAIIALMLFSFIFPSFVVSIWAGSIVDRISRKRIMILSALYRAVVLVLALLYFIFFADKSNLVSSLPVYGIILSLLIGVGTAFFYPAKMSSVPNVVNTENLKPATALISGSGTWALTFGALAASGLILKIGSLNIYYIACLMYIIPCLLLPVISFKNDSNQDRYNEKFDISKDIKKTFSFLFSHKKALNMIILGAALSLISAVFYNTMNTFASDFYHVSIEELSKLKCMLGYGTVLGVIIIVLFGKKFKTNKTIVAAFLGLFLCLITAAFCTTFSRAYLWLGLIGLFAAIMKVTIDTVLQKVSPNFIRGKIFAFVSVLETFVSLIGIAFVSLFVGIIHPITIFHCIAVVSAFMALGLLAANKEFRYFVLRITIGQIFKTLFIYKFEGVDNIPKKGKIILAGNHTGHLDPFIIQMALKRNLWFVTGPAAFKIPVIKHLLKWFNVLPLSFGSGLDAINNAVTKLKNAEAVIIFPEGKFTDDGSLCKFHRGVGIMAKEANCPIVPFAIKGGFEAWGKIRRKPKLFTKIVIQFGQPVTDLSVDEKEITHELEQRVRFMKDSLESRAFYNIKDTEYTNFLDIMKEYSDTYGQTMAVSLKTKEGYEEISYVDLSRRAKRFANYLIENIDIQRNDRIAIICESRPEFAVGIFASIQTGAITVPLDVKLTIPEHTHILTDCNPKIVLCSSHYLEHAIELKNNVNSIKEIFVLDDEPRGHAEIASVSKLDSNIEKNIARPRSMEETALIVYTSGTTGNPKGVMISFRNIYSQMKDFEKLFKLTKDNTLLSILPLNHLLELNVGFFGMLFMGAKIVYIKTLNPKELTSVMKEKKITNMIVVPLVAKMLKNSVDKQIKKQPEYAQKIFRIMYSVAQYMPRRIKRLMFKSIVDGFGGKFECFISGGAPLEPDIAEFFKRIGIPVFEGYGLTETSPVISTNDYKHHKIGTVGVPLPSVTVKLSEQGEILVSGLNVMQGYYNKPQMTAEVIDENGWFHTGDIGEIDKDGFVKITGRIKNMIVLGGGKKIFPEEVEAVLEASEYIKELCVLSLKIKSGNKAGTEEVGVIIVPSDELAKKSDEEIQKTLEEEVKSLSEKNLAPYKMPTVVVFRREDLPKTSTQKVKRKDLVNWYDSLSSIGTNV
ncbi:MAG: MFS transporter [Candidatus Gastranaerophilales bacterium]|nr:MFS transporter [Candidatus Gastranaerophilales bacterium]